MGRYDWSYRSGYDRHGGFAYDRDYHARDRAGRRYDYGLRGYRETAPRHAAGGRAGGGGFGYDHVYRERPGMRPNRVTARYNRDYVFPRPEERTANYNPFGGDFEGRIGDMGAYVGPYSTIGGTRTYRGASLPVGWERGYAGYDAGYWER